jgi:2-phosphoglycerate kinase
LGETFRVALIGGTSHVGKSTTARAVAAGLGWEAISTDSLARHPGRPWPRPDWAVPPDVALHYATLSPAQLLESVLAHYQPMWPMIRELIDRHANDADAGPLVLEGSALWPERFEGLDLPRVRAVWLTADHALIEARMRRESAFEAADPPGQALIRSFLDRTFLYDDALRTAAGRLGLPVIEATAAMSQDDVAAAVLAALGAG